jgi:hypothetical protein
MEPSKLNIIGSRGSQNSIGLDSVESRSLPSLTMMNDYNYDVIYNVKGFLLFKKTVSLN